MTNLSPNLLCPVCPYTFFLAKGVLGDERLLLAGRHATSLHYTIC